MVELHFPLRGEQIPADHGYKLFAGLSRLLPMLHANDCGVRIGPVRGAYLGRGILKLEPRRSRLQIRLSAEEIPTMLSLAGASVDLGDAAITLGIPQVYPLIPAPNLIARMVVIKASSPLSDPTDRRSRDRAATKRYLEPGAFLEAVRQVLKRRDILGIADLPIHESGDRAGQPRRHILQVRGKLIVGFTVLVQGLTADESIRLQEESLGGKSKMGCGFFVPAGS